MEAGQHIRDFILEKKIGAGGAGEVWRARHQHLDTTVAIKAIYREAAPAAQFQERFLAEASVMARLDHPHIVSVHDFFVVDGVSYLVMAYIAGGSLAALLQRRRRLPVAEALLIARGILEALHFAHSQGVIHRDVKPSNILVRPDGHAYLVDFGIALVAGKRRHTRFGMNIGTPEYMSPEQIQATALDHRTDVYSFGCVLYEMLAGQPPFSSQEAGQSEYEIMHSHLQAPPPALRALNPAVDAHTEAVVCRALAKDPAQRYGSCQELADVLFAPQSFPSGRDTPFLQDMKRTKPVSGSKALLTKLSITTILLVLVIVLGSIFLPKKTAENNILQKIHAGQLVVPVKNSAYDLWRNHIKDKSDQRILQREQEAWILLQLKDRGEQFFRHWQSTFSATDEEWLETSRVYEWATYLQTAQTKGNASIDVAVEQLCPGINEDMKRLCARYSYSLGQIDFRKDRLKEAARNYDRASFYDRNMCISYIGVGEVYVKEEKFANAEGPFSQSIRCDEKLCYGYFKLGKLFQRRDQQDMTDEQYAKAIQCAPENTDFLYAYARAFEDWKKYCKAINLFRSFLKVAKQSENVKDRSRIDDAEKRISTLEKQC